VVRRSRVCRPLVMATHSRLDRATFPRNESEAERGLAGMANGGLLSTNTPSLLLLLSWRWVELIACSKFCFHRWDCARCVYARHTGACLSSLASSSFASLDGATRCQRDSVFLRNSFFVLEVMTSVIERSALPRFCGDKNKCEVRRFSR